MTHDWTESLNGLGPDGQDRRTADRSEYQQLTPQPRRTWQDKPERSNTYG